MKNILPPILVLILFLAVWSVGAKIYDLVFLLPGPMLVAQAFVTDLTMVIEGATITLREAFIGYILAIVIGISVATIMSLSKILERSLYPYAILLQTVPVVAVAPLIVLWFGFEEKSVILSRINQIDLHQQIRFC